MPCMHCGDSLERARWIGSQGSLNLSQGSGSTMQGQLADRQQMLSAQHQGMGQHHMPLTNQIGFVQSWYCDTNAEVIMSECRMLQFHVQKQLA